MLCASGVYNNPAQVVYKFKLCRIVLWIYKTNAGIFSRINASHFSIAGNRSMDSRKRDTWPSIPQAYRKWQHML